MFKQSYSSSDEELKEFASEFVKSEGDKKRGDLTPRTRERIIAKKGLSSERADRLIKLIIESFPKGLAEAEYAKRVKHTNIYFRRLTRMGYTGLLYGEVADKFVRNRGKLDEKTIKIILDKRELRSEEADQLIYLIIEGLPEDDIRVKHTKAYFRRLTRIGNTGLLYGKVIDEFVEKGKLTDETEMKIVDNQGLYPEEAEQLTSPIIEGLPENDISVEHTKAYFRRLTRIGDTGLLCGKVADEFLQHLAELTHKTIDVFYKHRLLPEQVELIAWTIVHTFKSLPEDQFNQIKNAISHLDRNRE